MPKSSFVLYHDLRGPLELLSDEERGRLFSAIFAYSEDGVEPDFTGSLKLAFAFVKAALDRDAAAWEGKVQKRREAGSLGGKQTAAKRASAAFACSEEGGAAKQAEPVPVPDTVPVPDPVRETADKTPRASRFSPPSAGEVEEFCAMEGLSIDPGRFVDYYGQQGWKLSNGNPMKDWRSAVRYWARRDGGKQRGGMPSEDEYRKGW